MDKDQFEVLVAAILAAGAAASSQQPRGSGALAYDMKYAVEKLREYGFTHGTSRLPE
jgi:hypothetical protein